MNETFFLSNVCPQDIKNNSGIWNGLESFIQSSITENDSLAFVVTGSAYIPQKDSAGKYIVSYEEIGRGVSLPTHMFKVYLQQNKKKGALLSVILYPTYP